MNTKFTHLPICVLAGLASSVAFAQTYTVIDLSPGPVLSQAFGIDNSGRAVGTATSAVYDGSRFRAIAWDDAVPTIYPPLLGDQDAVAFAGAGSRIAAVSFSTGALTPHALLIDDGSLTSLGDFSPRDINGAGAIVGWAPVTLASGWVARQACIYASGSLSLLPGIGGTHSMAFAVNTHGDAVGSAHLAGDMHTHAVLWSAGAAHDLGTLGGLDSQATDVNDVRQATGHALTASGAPHAFIFQVAPNGSVTSRQDLGSLGGNMSYGRAINNQGMVVGTSDARAFLWDGSQMLDLNDLIDPASGWVLRAANGINDGGEIVGVGTHHGWPAAFMLVHGCLADVNHDGTLNFFDVQTFLNWFASGDLRADFIADGTLNFFDVQRFLALFSAGCP